MIKGSNEESWSVSNNFSPKIRGYSNPDSSFQSRKKQRKHFAVSPRRSSISFPSSGPGVFEICQKKRKEERKGKGKKEKRGGKKKRRRARTHKGKSGKIGWQQRIHFPNRWERVRQPPEAKLLQYGRWTLTLGRTTIKALLSGNF